MILDASLGIALKISARFVRVGALISWPADRRSVSPRSKGVHVLRILICIAAGCAGYASARADVVTASVPNAERMMVAPREVKAACAKVQRAAARQGSRWHVVCPPVVPWSRLTSVEVSGIGNLTDYGAGYLLDGLSPVGAFWTMPGDGHWTFAAGAPSAVGSWRTARNAAGRLQISFTRRAAVIRNRPVTIYRVPHRGMNEFSGHIVVEWIWRGEAYQVSVHRWLDDHQGLTQATKMAAALIHYLQRH